VFTQPHELTVRAKQELRDLQDLCPKAIFQLYIYLLGRLFLYYSRSLSDLNAIEHHPIPIHGVQNFAALFGSSVALPMRESGLTIRRLAEGMRAEFCGSSGSSEKRPAGGIPSGMTKLGICIPSIHSVLAEPDAAGGPILRSLDVLCRGKTMCVPIFLISPPSFLLDRAAVGESILPALAPFPFVLLPLLATTLFAERSGFYVHLQPDHGLWPGEISGEDPKAFVQEAQNAMSMIASDTLLATITPDVAAAYLFLLQRIGEETLHSVITALLEGRQVICGSTSDFVLQALEAVLPCFVVRPVSADTFLSRQQLPYFLLGYEQRYDFKNYQDMCLAFVFPCLLRDREEQIEQDLDAERASRNEQGFDVDTRPVEMYVFGNKTILLAREKAVTSYLAPLTAQCLDLADGKPVDVDAIRQAFSQVFSLLLRQKRNKKGKGGVEEAKWGEFQQEIGSATPLDARKTRKTPARTAEEDRAPKKQAHLTVQGDTEEIFRYAADVTIEDRFRTFCETGTILSYAAKQTMVMYSAELLSKEVHQPSNGSPAVTVESNEDSGRIAAKQSELNEELGDEAVSGSPRHSSTPELIIPSPSEHASVERSPVAKPKYKPWHERYEEKLRLAREWKLYLYPREKGDGSGKV